MMDFERFSMKIQMPRKMTKIMDLADFRRFREYAEIDSPKIQKRVRKIPKSNKKASSEAILLIIWPKMEPKDGGGRRPPPSFRSGRRPRPYLVEIELMWCLKSHFRINFNDFWLFRGVPIRAFSGGLRNRPKSVVFDNFVYFPGTVKKCQNHTFCLFWHFPDSTECPGPCRIHCCEAILVWNQLHAYMLGCW